MPSQKTEGAWMSQGSKDFSRILWDLLASLQIKRFTCTMNGPFTMCDSVTLWIGHLENTGLLSCEDHWNIDTFHCIIFLKITFTNITTNLIRKAFNYDKLLSSWWWIEVLQKLNFCLKAPILSLETNTISCVLWRDRHISFVSPESIYQIPSIWITIV